METAVIVIAVVMILAALSMEMKLARANRIARATHDLIKELLELAKKDDGHRPPLQPEVRAGLANEESQTAEPEVYKI